MPLTFLQRLMVRAGIASGRTLRDLPPHHQKIIQRVRPFTMTSNERLAALISATEYVIAARIPGAIAECGVWEGGSMMAVAETLLYLRQERELYLYDTFEGMSVPTDRDHSITGDSAPKVYNKLDRAARRWDHAPLERVRSHLASTGWPSSQSHFVAGRVEDTIPGTLPGPLALLRLD